MATICDDLRQRLRQDVHRDLGTTAAARTSTASSAPPPNWRPNARTADAGSSATASRPTTGSSAARTARARTATPTSTTAGRCPPAADPSAQDRRDDPGEIAQPGHLRRPELPGRPGGRARPRCVDRRAGRRPAWCPCPATPAAPSPRCRRAPRRGRAAARARSCGLGLGGAVAADDAARGRSRSRRTTVHQPTRSTCGASSARTCSFAGLPCAAAMWSISSSSRWASSSPVCGRMLST